MGPDRIVDAVAALRLHRPPLIVVDVGTAIVFDAISREGDYLGGAIAPGIGLATDALAQKAAMLRRVDLRPPKHAVGNNTTAAMQSGVLFGYAELIEGMVRRFKAEIGEDAWVVATGGWAPLMSELTKAFDHVDLDLTLQGLRELKEKNDALAASNQALVAATQQQEERIERLEATLEALQQRLGVEVSQRGSR